MNRSLLVRGLVRSVAGLAIICLLLFPPAGTWAWPQAWVFLGLFTGCSAVTGWLLRHDPALVEERMKSPFAGDQKPADRAIILAIFAAFLGWLVFMALDARRFGWSHTPAWAQVAGALLIVLAFAGWISVMRANSFAATTIRLQPERRQTVVTAGPYGVVRHPMYAYLIPLMVGTPLLLGSLWGLLGLVLVMPLVAARALGEEAMLTAGLPGYAAYARKVRFRLVPGVW